MSNKIYNDKNNPNKYFYIGCNSSGKMIKISNELINILKYTPNELDGKFIGILMSPFISYLYKRYFIPKYENCKYKYKKKIMITDILSKNKRPLIIYDKNNKPIYVYLYIDVNNFINTLDIVIHIIFEFVKEPLNNQIYTSETMLLNKTDDFKVSKNKIVIVSIDFKDSTKLLVSNGTVKMINIYKKFHNDVILLIKSKYYPYIYIHEIIGDCFIIVSNINWSYDVINFCASIIISFIFNLYNITKKYINIRIGISYGHLYCGYIDHNFRLFGIPINLASRLENVCVNNCVCCDENYFNKLLDEKLKNIEKLEYIKAFTELKGLGFTNYYNIFLELQNNIDIITNIFK